MVEQERQYRNRKGFAVWWPLFFAAGISLVFTAGVFVGKNYRRDTVTFYGLHLQRVVGVDSWNLVSKETGPFRADFCPENKVSQYEPRAGYVLCRLKYVDRGCMDVSGNNGFTWVKGEDGWTTILNDNDTFSLYPDCKKDEPIALNH